MRYVQCIYRGDRADHTCGDPPVPDYAQKYQPADFYRNIGGMRGHIKKELVE